MSNNSSESDEKCEDIDYSFNRTFNVNINSYRKRMKSYIELQMYDSALFWADKIVDLGEDDPEDIYWFAECLFYTENYKRAQIAILRHCLENIDIRSFNLLLHCLLKLEKFSDAINLLKKFETDVSAFSRLLNNLKSFPPEQQRNLEGARLFLGGKIYEAINCASKAAEIYKQALKTDIHCYEALDILVQHHLLPVNEELAFVESLPYSKQCSDEEEMEIVCNIYKSMLNKYHKPQDLNNMPKLPAKLVSSMDLTVSKAEILLYNLEYKECRKITKRLLENDPFHSRCLEIEIVCLYKLKKTADLLLLSQRLINTIPNFPVAWYAAGCYYQLLEKGELARKYFNKATTLDMAYAPALIANANSLAMENEQTGAETAYIHSSKMLIGCYLPVLALGIDAKVMKRSNDCFVQALKIAPSDPYLWNEMGILHYKNEDYRNAQRHFLCGLVELQAVGVSVMSELWDTLINNLAHTNRKLHYFPYALHFHKMSLKLSPATPSTYRGMSFLYTIAGDLDKAFEYFDRAHWRTQNEEINVHLIRLIVNRLMRWIGEEPLEVYKFRTGSGISPLVKLVGLASKKVNEGRLPRKYSLELPKKIMQLQLQQDEAAYTDTIIATFLIQKAFRCKLSFSNMSRADVNKLARHLQRHIQNIFQEVQLRNEARDSNESETYASFSRSHSGSDIENYGDDNDFYAESDSSDFSQTSSSSTAPSVVSSGEHSSHEDSSARTRPKTPLPVVPPGTAASTRRRTLSKNVELEEEDATEATSADTERDTQSVLPPEASVAPLNPPGAEENAEGASSQLPERTKRILQEQGLEDNPLDPQMPFDLASERLQFMLPSFDLGLDPFMTEEGHADNASFVPQEININEDRLSPETSLSFASCLSYETQSFPCAEFSVDDVYYSTEMFEAIGEYIPSEQDVTYEDHAADDYLEPELLESGMDNFADASDPNFSPEDSILNKSFGSPTPVESTDIPTWNLEAETSAQNPSSEASDIASGLPIWNQAGPSSWNPSSSSPTQNLPTRPTSRYLPSEMPSRTLSPTQSRSSRTATRRFSAETSILGTPPRSLPGPSSRSLQLYTPRHRRQRSVESLRRIALIGNMLQSFHIGTETEGSYDSELDFEDTY